MPVDEAYRDVLKSLKGTWIYRVTISNWAVSNLTKKKILTVFSDILNPDYIKVSLYLFIQSERITSKNISAGSQGFLHVVNVWQFIFTLSQ